MSTPRTRSQVLVVGAGPVGLSAAIELATRGVDVVIVEKQSRAGYHPRAKTTHVRTVEHMRRWGIAEKLREASPLPPDYPTDVIFTTRLRGRELAHFRNAFFGDRVRDDRFSEAAQWIPQYKVEAVLRDKVATLPNVETRLSTEFVSLDATDDGVVARLRSEATGETSEIAADYLIGADGLASAVRRALGVAMSGQRDLGRHVNVIARSPDLARLRPDNRAIMYWLCNPDCPGVLSPMDSGDVWAFMCPAPAGDEKLSDARLRELLDLAVGEHVEAEFLAIDYWTATRATADSYGGGRVFLAGDACHVHPPFGGYGMNMGIADAVDIGWKVAATLQGWGGPGLVANYEAERRPVHDAVMDEAVKNYALLPKDMLHPDLEANGPTGDAARRMIGDKIREYKANEFHTLGIVLGVNYAGSPLVIADGTPAPALSRIYSPSAHPGCLAPHAWLADGASLYDRFGPGFTLLCLAHVESADIAAFERAAREAGAPLRVVHVENENLRDLYGATLALVRPDQYVAWRGDGEGGAARDVLDRARGAF